MENTTPHTLSPRLLQLQRLAEGAPDSASRAIIEALAVHAEFMNERFMRLTLQLAVLAERRAWDAPPPEFTLEGQGNRPDGERG